MKSLTSFFFHAIGSSDSTYLNEKLIGSLGDYKENHIFSAWNRPRVYSFDPRILKNDGTDKLKIDFLVLDEKAGLHKGDIVFGNYNTLASLITWQKLLNEYYPVGVLFVIAFITCFLS